MESFWLALIAGTIFSGTLLLISELSAIVKALSLICAHLEQLRIAMKYLNPKE